MFLEARFSLHDSANANLHIDESMRGIMLKTMYTLDLNEFVFVLIGLGSKSGINYPYNTCESKHMLYETNRKAKYRI